MYLKTMLSEIKVPKNACCVIPSLKSDKAK